MEIKTSEQLESNSLWARLVRSGALYAIVLLGAVVWALWPDLTAMYETWGTNPAYEHGYLVPLFAVGLLWWRRDSMPAMSARPDFKALGFFALGMASQFFGDTLYVKWLDGFALLLYLCGVVQMYWGLRGLIWAGPSIIILFFMIPLPYTIEQMMKYPLQRISTLASAYTLQTLGFTAIADGTLILMNHATLGVVDACSGLRMLMMFFFMTIFAAFILDRPIEQKVLIVLSALPIAILSNVIRISLTGIMHELVGEEWANRVFHDFAGWLMMPTALGMLWVELKVLSHLIFEETEARLVPVVLPGAGRAESRRRLPGGPGSLRR